jgi:hypothetical protein
MRVRLFWLPTRGESNRDFARARHALVTPPDPCPGDGLNSGVKDGRQFMTVYDGRLSAR